jgi:hypothetical protein
VERPVIDEALAKLLEHHKGRWVAVDGSTIVAVGDSASEVIKGALEAGVTDPLVFKVATHPERLNFL